MMERVVAKVAGRTALAALRGGSARVFAAFERSCYVETATGIACLGGPGLGLGPLNAIAEDFAVPAAGDTVSVDLDSVQPWRPRVPSDTKKNPRIGIPRIETPASIRQPAQAFLDWIAGKGKPDDALIGLGPGLTPAGDDFVGGAMIALRAAENDKLADRVAAWALPLAETRTSRISRAHLHCAAAGEGHEALHDLLCFLEEKCLERLARVGHTSGLDAAAGALLARRVAVT